LRIIHKEIIKFLWVHAPNDSKGASLPSFGKKNNLGSKLFAIEIKKKKGEGGGNPNLHNSIL